MQRPVEAEVESAKLTIQAAAKTGCRTIIAHVSAPETMELIGKAHREGVEIDAETCFLKYRWISLYPP